MDQWEYLNIVINAEKDQWVTTFAGVQLVGLEAILSYFGSLGWELASFTPILYESTPSRQTATIFLAIFKRRKVLVYYSPQPSQE